MGERFLGRLRRGFLDDFVILNERPGHRLVKEYKGTCNHAWPHQGIEQRIPCRTGRLNAPSVTAKLSSRPVLNGLHHEPAWRGTTVVAQCDGGVDGVGATPLRCVAHYERDWRSTDGTGGIRRWWRSAKGVSTGFALLRCAA